MVGYITPITGNSELLRNWLIENGAKWSRNWGWYFEGEAPVLPIGLTASTPIHWEELQSEKASGEYVGTVGEKLSIRTYCAAIYKTTSSNLCYLFKDIKGDGNEMIWFTKPREIKLNELYLLTGTVKKHQIFRDQRQTIMTRCKVEPIDL